jgi:hypothetical protein
MIRYNEININNYVKYNDLIFESLKKTALKRIRIRVDPAQVSAEADFSKVDGYEGYVLEEGKSHLKILVLSPEMSIQDIPVEYIEMLSAQDEYDSFCQLKGYLTGKLIQDGMVENNPIIQQINNSQCLNDIEAIIKQCGYTGDKLAEVYRDFITDES